jgi:hypothetical protein
MTDKLNGRVVHIWTGRNRTTDVGRLADAIAAALVPVGLCNHAGGLAQLDKNGGLSPINFDALRKLIDKYVAGLRIVQRDGEWRKEYYAYAFPQAVRYNLNEPTRPPPDISVPDNTVLDEIYRVELAARLPKATA